MSKGGKNCLEFIESVKNIVDQLEAIGKPVEEEDLISYILGYFAQCEKSISLTNLQSELFAFDALLEELNSEVYKLIIITLQ